MYFRASRRECLCAARAYYSVSRCSREFPRSTVYARGGVAVASSQSLGSGTEGGNIPNPGEVINDKNATGPIGCECRRIPDADNRSIACPNSCAAGGISVHFAAAQKRHVGTNTEIHCSALRGGRNSENPGAGRDRDMMKIECRSSQQHFRDWDPGSGLPGRIYATPSVDHGTK